MSRASSRAAIPAAAGNGLHASALQARRNRDLRSAARFCDLALDRDAANSEVHHLRGLIHRDAGELRDAIHRFDRAIALRANVAAYHLDLANVLLAAGRLVDAAESADEASRLEPQHLAAWHTLGNVRYACGDGAGAIAAYERAVACDPAHAQANNNLGTVLLQQGELERAQHCFRQALASHPRYAIAANNLGSVHEALGDHAAAESWFAAAASLDPAYVEPLLNLAISLDKRGEWQAAAAELRRVLSIMPRNIRAQWNLALLDLRTGAFRSGWDGFDVGIGIADYRGTARPHAQSKFAADAKRVLLWSEQGPGETLLGLSMLPDLVARGVGGVVETDARLIAILTRSFPGFTFVATILPPDPRTLGSFDSALPLLGLGRALRPEIGAFPRHAGYLRADARRVAELRARYQGGTTDRLVGISWCSGARRNADAKSSDLAQWAPILDQPGTRFISLQYGDDAPMIERANAGMPTAVIDDPEIDQLRNLDDAAAQVAAMDHIVTVSNTTAHLAGALGRPATVLLPRDRGLLWFWFTDRPDSPWYPSLTLLRQGVSGRWDDVIAAAAKRLVEQRQHP
ncbi:MAG: tetratricopeptide repeat protein [Alphaproteobacteria bacterium]|nr:tetratricopeptide repeat protein [Alphaproteobacteria bacterium]